MQAINRKGSEMKNYINTSETWGDPVEVTADDYRLQIAAFGDMVGDTSNVEEREDGIYINGERVAVPVDEYGRED